MDGKTYQFYAMSVAGLEDLALDDMQRRLGPLQQVHTERGKAYGRIFFTHRRSPLKLLELPCIHDVFALVGQIYNVAGGREGLRRIVEQVEKWDLQPARRLVEVCGGPGGNRFELAASVQGQHRFKRRDLDLAVGEALVRHHGLAPGSGPQALRLQVQVTGRRAFFGVRLPARRPQTTGGRPPLISGALAYCLGCLLGIEAEDTGLVLEGAGDLEQYWPARQVIYGGPRAIAQVANWIRCRPGNLPLDGTSLDWIMGDGRPQVGPYWQELLTESARVLVPGGVALIVGPAPPVGGRVVEEGSWPLGVIAEIPIYLEGRPRSILMLERWPEEELLTIEMGSG
ncbi:MAG: hypothetical protein GKR89_27635 [Candidatus Latescibacteria bacterium]|nr:hypothetical protein [Candidatus Latescibacterota bacterium]